jgi:hypothetical protein
MNTKIKAASKTFLKFLAFTAGAVGALASTDPTFTDRLLKLGWKGVAAPVIGAAIKAALTYWKTEARQ